MTLPRNKKQKARNPACPVQSLGMGIVSTLPTSAQSSSRLGVLIALLMKRTYTRVINEAWTLRPQAGKGIGL